MFLQAVERLYKHMAVEDYDLLELIDRDEERESFRAREIATSREVIVHIVQPGLAKLASSVFTGRPPVELLFVGESGEKSYIVTGWSTECRDIRKWLEQQSRRNSTPAPEQSLGRAGAWRVPSISARPQAAEPSEFTRMFSAPGSGPAAEPKEPSSEAGEFTRLFQAPQDVPQSPVQGFEPQPPPTPVEASEFTLMFQTPQDVPQDPVQGLEPEAPPAPAEPGEFTRMFQAPPVTPRTLKPDSPPASAEAGEFTRLFKAKPLPETKKAEPSEFSRVFAAPAKPAPANDNLFAQPLASTPSSASEAATGIFSARPEEPVMTSQPPAGPSEYTMMMAVPAPKTVSPEPPPPPAPVAEKASEKAPEKAPEKTSPPPSYWTLILILNGLFLLAVALIVYFALKK